MAVRRAALHGWRWAIAVLAAVVVAGVSAVSVGSVASAGGSGGVVTDYPGGGIDHPFGIVAGPDGALWFTNYIGNSIGRITTTGVVANYTGKGISQPGQITVGPDGALWFINGNNVDSSIGRAHV